ncbi:MAG: DUF362 domain-containing protein [Candidatus Micrarchaeota archaeon]
MARVSISRGKDIDKTVRDALSLLGGIRGFVREGDVVFIKPNIVAQFFPATTKPEVVRSIIELCIEANAKKVYVGENPMCQITSHEIFETTGLKEYYESYGAKVLLLDNEEYVNFNVPGGKVYKRIKLPKVLMESDVYISVPKMKTHCITKVTLAIKNAHGLLRDVDKGKHHCFELEQKLVDINKARSPNLVVMDAFSAMEGFGPTFGTAKKMNLALASDNIVSIDSVASRIMGYSPMSIGTTKIAANDGLGEPNPIVLGIPIEKVKRRFKPGTFTIPKRIGGARFVGGKTDSGYVGMLKLGLGLFFGFSKSFSEEFGNIKGLTIVYGYVQEGIQDDKVLLYGDDAMRTKVKARRILKMKGHPPTNWITLMKWITSECNLDVLDYFINSLWSAHEHRGGK